MAGHDKMLALTDSRQRLTRNGADSRPAWKPTSGYILPRSCPETQMVFFLKALQHRMEVAL